MHPLLSSVQRPSVEILTINSSEQDCSALQNIVSHSNWRYHCVHTLPEGAAFLRRNPVPVVICHRALSGGTWRDVVSLAREQDIPARVLVYCSKADDQFWMEVLESGGYDVLLKPFQASEVYRLVTLASQSWRKEAEQRDRPQLMHHKVSA
jgi:DNA-binding response OmpR family regulator